MDWKENQSVIQLGKQKKPCFLCSLYHSRATCPLFSSFHFPWYLLVPCPTELLLRDSTGHIYQCCFRALCKCALFTLVRSAMGWILPAFLSVDALVQVSYLYCSIWIHDLVSLCLYKISGRRKPCRRVQSVVTLASFLQKAKLLTKHQLLGGMSLLQRTHTQHHKI